jgi:hypothetical protein
MARRDWKRFRPTSLQEAIEACVEYGRDRHQMSIDRIAEEIGLPSKWALYKWIEAASLPARLIRPFESACRCTFITQHLAASARKLLVDIPTGRKATSGDIHVVQDACNEAVGALLGFASGKNDAADTIAAITTAMERLARERAEVERHTQPELGTL